MTTIQRWAGENRVARLLAAGLVLLLAACADGPSLPGAASTTSGAGTARAIAFEPVVGVPDRLASQFATDLGAEAARRNLVVVARENTDNVYRVKGYFSALSESNATRIVYVWDIFDAAGQRASRINGEATAPGSASDPWDNVTPEIMTAIASQSITDLEAFVGQPSASTPTVGAASALALTAAESDGLSAETLRPQRTRDQSGIGPSLATRGNSGPRVFVAPISGMEGAASILTRAIGRELGALGARIVADPSEADMWVSAQASKSPEEGRLHAVGIVWSVQSRAGDVLGSVRQLNKLAPSALEDWASEAENAARAAAPGLYLLMTGA